MQQTVNAATETIHLTDHIDYLRCKDAQLLKLSFIQWPAQIFGHNLERVLSIWEMAYCDMSKHTFKLIHIVALQTSDTDENMRWLQKRLRKTPTYSFIEFHFFLLNVADCQSTSPLLVIHSAMGWLHLSVLQPRLFCREHPMMRLGTMKNQKTIERQVGWQESLHRIHQTCARH